MTVDSIVLMVLVSMLLIVGGLVSYVLHVPLPVGGF